MLSLKIIGLSSLRKTKISNRTTTIFYNKKNEELEAQLNLVRIKTDKF